jgi:hypothetical protein
VRSTNSFAEAIAALEALGSQQTLRHHDSTKWKQELAGLNQTSFQAEFALGLEPILTQFAVTRRITPELQQAYALHFPRVAAEQSLADFYASKVAIGPDSAAGVLHGLRGKLFELRLPATLEARFPGFNFSLSASPTQSGWDLIGTNSEGITVFVQAKARGSSAVHDVVERMNDEGAPAYFAVTKELHGALLASRPELADRLVTVDVSNLQLVTEVKSAMATIAEQLNFEIPEAVTDALPYVGEIVLGIRLIVDVVSNERQLETLPRGDKNRLHAVRTLALMARFGITTVVTTASGAAGTTIGTAVFPGVGTAAGGIFGAIGGALGAGYLNTKLAPHMLDYGLGFAGITRDDLFYYQNSSVIDRVGVLLSEQRATAERSLLRR